MRRRDFIAGLCSAATWPLAAWAQRSEQARLGVLVSGRRDGPLTRTLRDELARLGWVEGHNLRIDFRSDEGVLNAASGGVLPNLVAVIIVANIGLGAPPQSGRRFRPAASIT
jgi:hypothetical protein